MAILRPVGFWDILKKSWLQKVESEIFDIKEGNFKKMLKQRKAEGRSMASVLVVKKGGKSFPCDITSAVFLDEDGIENSIITLTDKTQRILDQKIIDAQKEKLVSENIILALAKSDQRLATNNKWIQIIAKASYDVMWDWNVKTGAIYVGDSAEELFGYKVFDHTVCFTDFMGCLLHEEKGAVEKKLQKALASTKKAWNDSFALKRQDGTVAATRSRASIIRDGAGQAVRLIGAIKDISKLQKLEKNLAEQAGKLEAESEKFLLTTKLSFDVIWDYNLETNEMFLGEGYEEMFGYAIKNNKGTLADWKNHIHPDDKEGVEKKLENAIALRGTHYEDAYQFIRADGSIAKVISRANIFRHANGAAYKMIGAMQDLSQQKDLEEKLNEEINCRSKLFSESEANFKLIFNSSSDILYDIDLITNKLVISDGYTKNFGYPLKNNSLSTESLFSHIHPEDKEALLLNYEQMLLSQGTEWKYSFRFCKRNGEVANVVTSCLVLRNAAGKAYRRIGYIQDQSKQIVLEEKLQEEVRLKEKQISDAAEEAKDTERFEIGKELHDNINQLLGVSKLYLDMAKGGEDSKLYLSRSSEYMNLAIEEIRKLSKGLTTDTLKNIGLCEVIEKVCHDLMETKRIKITCILKQFVEKSVTDKFKINLFRMVQEHLNNVFKHAEATMVTIKLLQNEKIIQLTIADNGIGFNTTKTQNGVGIASIKSRAITYNGLAKFTSKPEKGCLLQATFPVSPAIWHKRSSSNLVDATKNELVEKVKEVIIELVHYSSEQLVTNFSVHLNKKLEYDYTYLSNLFTEVEGITIQKFIIAQKIERVKELMVYNELTLTQIAKKLHYSSVAHLSNQFKKTTGMSPSFFKSTQ